MLIFLAFTLYLSFSSPDNAQALPLLDSSGAANRTSFVPTEPSSCSDLGHCRTIWDIVWSCLVVIFTCNWIAIHPNIPGPNDSRQDIILRRVHITVISLIAPEFVVVWALRQWYVARKYEKEFKVHGWTMTHSFFALMGGFMLFEHDRPVRILLPDDIEQLEKNGIIDFPSITKEQIEDRSKGDLVSKGLVVVQTTWFILQCIARGVERLPVTELEIMTLAYATLNLVTYALWLHKPLNVQYSFRIHKRSQTEQTIENDGDGHSEQGVTGWRRVMTFIRDTSGCVTTFMRDTSGCVTTFMRNTLRRVVTFMRDASSESDPQDCLNAMEAVIDDLLQPFLDMAGLGQEMQYRSLRVPTYHAGDMNGISFGRIVRGSIMIATIFGGIHCIAWSFEFPSHQEQILWRASSLAVTCIPLTLLLITVAGTAYQQYGILAANSQVSGILDVGIDKVGEYMIYIAFIAYIYARLDLIIQAFMSLRTLPRGAYETVHWTTFIPHI